LKEKKNPNSGKKKIKKKIKKKALKSDQNCFWCGKIYDFLLNCDYGIGFWPEIGVFLIPHNSVFFEHHII
jgi:hypothetical protein